MTKTDESGTEDGIAADRRWAANFCCLWRVCAQARCRRARTCRGHAHTCARRNRDLIPPLVREFFTCVLAAKSVDLPFERFRADMEGTDAARAYFAWRRARE